MNLSHSRITDWGLSHVTIENNFAILDVGSGGGKTIQKLAATASDGKIYGIDYARGSVAVASGKNAQLIRDGRQSENPYWADSH
jgi:ubiquinone/menaquinone biosynthesis C-methylase UbiE